MSHRPPRSALLLVPLASAAAIAGCGGQAGVNGSSSAPATAPPSVAPGALQPGARLDADTFTASIPVDWSVKPTTTPSSGGPQSATVRETEVDSPRRDAAMIVVEYPNAIFPAAVLSESLDDFVSRVVALPTGSSSPQAVQPRTHVKVAGEDGVVLSFQDIYNKKPAYSRFAVFRHLQMVYVITLGTTPTDAASYGPALDTVLTTWAWK